MRIALYQPDIAGNVGSIMRLAACMDVPLDIIQPCGFPLGDRQLKRAAMDYGASAQVQRHSDWQDFYGNSKSAGRRLVLLSSKAQLSIYDAAFTQDDVLLMGSESAGVPDHVRDAADLALTIPMAPGFRSLNVALACAMTLGEALRQCRGHFDASATGIEGNWT